MFSIAAINDTDSKDQWEPLAPTKEAQEFHLSQTYQEGLMRLQAQDYSKAQELFEAVLRDPLTASSTQVGNNTRDCHMLQLRFLALKNLATVFLQQGAAHYESALQCYLAAVEIDGKDSVVWNQLGTLSCNMGLLSISRWAFEQGLLCSPNNWNCMEKLLEVLIAIGDEVSCVSVSEMILCRWPSHSRALQVKKLLETAEPVPFASRGIDRLEPKHVRLRFTKRRSESHGDDDGRPLKKTNKTLVVHLPEASSGSLLEAIVKILAAATGGCNDTGDLCNTDDLVNEKLNCAKFFIVPDDATLVKSEECPSMELEKYAGAKLRIVLPSNAEATLDEEAGSLKAPQRVSAFDYLSLTDYGSNRPSGMKDKEASLDEEHPLERRSTRLERLRNRKPEKDESGNVNTRDQAEALLQLLDPFIVDGSCMEKVSPERYSTIDSDFPTSEMEDGDFKRFVEEVSNNYGAYHVGHLLLEAFARKVPFYHENFFRLLELEKLTRSWTQDRTPCCSLFLAELYYDIGSHSSVETQRKKFFSEASYHLCKVTEAVSLAISDPLNPCSFDPDQEFSYGLDINAFKQSRIVSNSTEHENSVQENCLEDSKLLQVDKSMYDQLFTSPALLPTRWAFWVRFHWLSGRLLACSNNKAKAYDAFNVALSFFINGTDVVKWEIVLLPHCRDVRYISLNRVLYEKNLIKIEDLLSKSNDMIAKGMLSDCVGALSPLVLCNKDLYFDVLVGGYCEQKGLSLVEISALDFLISSYEKEKLLRADQYLSCHWRKLQILTAAAEMIESPLRNASNCKKTTANLCISSLGLEASEKTSRYWHGMVAEEVREISQCASRLKDSIDENAKLDASVIPVSIIAQIQKLLLKVMSDIVRRTVGQKSSGMAHVESRCFVDAVIAFCKLQHAAYNVPVKTQVDLIVTIHELLAEYGLCCAGKDNEGEEGIFLKLAIKHLLALDVKLKSTQNLPNNISEMKEDVKSSNICISVCETSLRTTSFTETEKTMSDKDESNSLDRDTFEEATPERSLLNEAPDKDEGGSEIGKNMSDQKLQCRQMKVQSMKSSSTDFEQHYIEVENQKVELGIDNALDQSFFCLYGLNLKSGAESSGEEDLAVHRNTNRGDYQTKEQCADVFRYLLPYAKASSRSGLAKLRRVLRAIHKHFPQPPEEILKENSIDKFLDSHDLCEDKLTELAGSGETIESINNLIFPGGRGVDIITSSEPYLEVYSNLYFFLAQAEDMNVTDKWPGFILTKEGEEFIEQHASLYKYDLLYNPLRFESWQRLANIYDEEVDLMLNDGSKHINVKEWRKQTILPQRVEISRRRSRRCFLMSLALSRSPPQLGEIHELLALVYYDSIQNVVPFYDQRLVIPRKDATWTMFCKNSMKHFEKAFAIKPEWSHALYLGKLSEKLGCPYEKAFSYYSKASSINPSAVDAFYRTHASRLKLLNACGKHDLHALQVVAEHAFQKSAKDSSLNLFGKTDTNLPQPSVDEQETTLQANLGKDERKIELQQSEEAWESLYADCLSALEVCVEGELKHFHKARYMLAQGLYRRGYSGDLQRAKEELSFCFKSSRSAFTIYMWEIDGVAKKGRRRVVGNRKNLELGLPESSRKFITCIRKYTLFYLNLLEKSGDFCTLERAHTSLRTDRRFSLCLEDIVPVALGRYVQALCSSIQSAEADSSSTTVEGLLERLFHVFIENGSIWNELSSLPEVNSSSGSGIPESILHSYVHQYIHSLEIAMRLDALEVINERIRKRFKNPKLTNNSSAKICKHASAAWCRCIIVSLASISITVEAQMEETQAENGPDSDLQLYVDIQENELWCSSFEEPVYQKELELKGKQILSKIKNLPVKQAAAEHKQTAATLLRCAYNFYRDSYSGMHPCGIKLYTVGTPSTQTQLLPGAENINSPRIDVLDLSIPRKLLLWAYTLVYGHYSGILSVVKHCEENVKLRQKRCPMTSVVASQSCQPATHAVAVKDRSHQDNHGETDDNPSSIMVPATSQEINSKQGIDTLASSVSNEDQKVLLSTVAPLHQCSTSSDGCNVLEGKG